MKKITLIYFLILIPLTTFARTTAFCEDEGARQSISLTVQNHKIISLLVYSERWPWGPKFFKAHEVKSSPLSTVYTMSGRSILLQVQNKILNGQNGWLNFDKDKFHCSAN